MQFNRENFIFNYGMDFSKEDIFNNLIDNSKDNHKNKSDIYCVNDENKEKLFKIRNDLFLLAKRNNAKVTVCTNWRIPSCCILIEGKELDITAPETKSNLKNIMEKSNSIKLKAKNDNFLLIVEVNIFTKLPSNKKIRKK